MPDFSDFPILTPSDFASLQNTLISGQVLSQMEAERVAQQQALEQRTREATQVANAAQRTYGQLAAQPPPDVSPNEQFLNTLGGGIAAVLQGTQAPAERAAQRTTETRAALLRTRIENLQALRENVQQKAQIAQRVGDLEAETNARQRFEQLSKTLDVVQQSERLASEARQSELDRTAAMARVLEQTRSALEIAKLKTVPTPMTEADLLPYVDTYETMDGETVPVVKTAEIPALKERNAVNKLARQLGVNTANKDEGTALDLIKAVRDNITNIAGTIIPLLPEEGGAERFAQGTIGNRFLAATQLGEKGSILAGYPATRTAAIQTIQALAVLGKGLRINQAEIAAAQNFDYPRIDDTQGTALEKFRILRMMLRHIENAILGRPTPEAEVREVIEKAAAFKQGRAAAGETTTGVPPVAPVDTVGAVRYGRDAKGNPIILNPRKR